MTTNASESVDTFTAISTNQHNEIQRCACGGTMVFDGWDEGERGWRIGPVRCDTCGKSEEAADAIRALESYQREAAAAEKASTGREQARWTYRRRQVEACIRIMQRVEASRTEPDWEPPTQPDWMVNPSDEELRRVSRSVTDDELERLR